MFPDWKDNLFITAMVPGDLRRLTMVDNKVVDQEILLPELGRLRNVVTVPDGSILLATDGSDGKIVRLYKD
jgi:glucose/arabinose dehydrogenase